MTNAILVGKEETFRDLGFFGEERIDLDLLIKRLKAQFEKEYYDCDNLGQDILEGVKDIHENRVDRRPWQQVLNEI